MTTLSRSAGAVGEAGSETCMPFLLPVRLYFKIIYVAWRATSSGLSKIAADALIAAPQLLGHSLRRGEDVLGDGFGIAPRRRRLGAQVLPLLLQLRPFVTRIGARKVHLQFQHVALPAQAFQQFVEVVFGIGHGDLLRARRSLVNIHTCW